MDDYIVIRNGKVSRWDYNIEDAAYDEEWDDESGVSAEEFLHEKGYFLIPVPDLATAQEIALNYNGEYASKVRSKAFEIISYSYGFVSWSKTKEMQIKRLVNSGEIAFKKINESTIEVFYNGESSEFTNDNDDWDYQQTVPIMLDINGDKDLIIFLLKSLGVENDN